MTEGFGLINYEYEFFCIFSGGEKCFARDRACLNFVSLGNRGANVLPGSVRIENHCDLSGIPEQFRKCSTEARLADPGGAGQADARRTFGEALLHLGECSAKRTRSQDQPRFPGPVAKGRSVELIEADVRSHRVLFSPLRF